MKVIIAGSRDITRKNVVAEAVADSGWFGEITEIVSGGAQGVDQMGEDYADEMGIDRVTFHANWKRRGKSAGPQRNRRMAAYADRLIAVMKQGGSAGTQNMIDEMEKLGKDVYVWLEVPRAS